MESPTLAPLADSRGDALEAPTLVVPDLITRQDDARLRVIDLKTAGWFFS